MQLEKYSFGIGDRFAHQGEAQLQALIKAKQDGIDMVPVWNKSFREHSIIHSEPKQTQTEAETAVANLNWQDSYYIDADHVNIDSVDAFIPYANFFTLDVADYIGKPAPAEEIQAFVAQNQQYLGQLIIPGIEQAFVITTETLTTITTKFSFAI